MFSVLRSRSKLLLFATGWLRSSFWRRRWWWCDAKSIANNEKKWEKQKDDRHTRSRKEMILSHSRKGSSCLLLLLTQRSIQQALYSCRSITSCASDNPLSLVLLCSARKTDKKNNEQNQKENEFEDSQRVLMKRDRVSPPPFFAGKI